MASNEDDQPLESQGPIAEKDYAQLLDEYSHLAPPADGELLRGHVLKITDKEVIVDFGYKSEGLVPLEQVQLPDGTIPYSAGDSIDVMVDRNGPRQPGYVLLSHRRANETRAWDNLERAHRENLTISGRVVAAAI